MKSLRLGQLLDPATRAAGGPLDLDPADLTTHGCIIGMTGSGKTGLGIVLIEECLRAGISVIAVDPKGDLGDLLLLFPELAASDFAAWVDPQAAQRSGQSPIEAGEAARAAALAGLATSGLGPADVARLKAGHEATLYTPGSSAGTPLALLATLARPAAGTPDDEARERIATLAGGLLSLAGIDPDPIRSREAVLVGRLIEAGWSTGRDLALADLIQGIFQPGFDRLGALPLEIAFPARDRAQLATRINNLLASPTFAGFLEGEPLDVGRMLGAGGGVPRLSIVSIAHLGEGERLFVTAVLAEAVRSWMRTQSGTAALRGLFYLDEVVGFLPPHPLNPATKPPLLGLLKQARAFGLGLVLATQNPVDLDYKALANMGTWLIGRLQTEQDQARLAEGLTGAIRAQGGDEGAAVRLLGALEKRVFLLQDVHRKGPELMRSRYAMSYLRGPLTRADLEKLSAGGSGGAAPGASRSGVATAATAAASAVPAPAWLKERFLDRKGGAFLRPHLLVRAAVRYRVNRGNVEEQTVLRAFPLAPGGAAAEVLEGEPIEVDEAGLTDHAPADVSRDDEGLAQLGDRKAVEKAVRDRLPDRLAAALLLDPVSKLLSRPGEERDAFCARIEAASASAASKAKALKDRLEARRLDLATAEQDLAGRKREKWVAVGSAVLTNAVGFLFGRRRTISGAGAVMSKDRMEGNAESRIEKLKAEIAALEADLSARTGVDDSRFEERRLVPSRADVDVLRVELVWIR